MLSYTESQYIKTIVLYCNISEMLCVLGKQDSIYLNML